MAEGVMVKLTSFSRLMGVIHLYIFNSLSESHGNAIEDFSLLYEQKEMQ